MTKPYLKLSVPCLTLHVVQAEIVAGINPVAVAVEEVAGEVVEEDVVVLPTVEIVVVTLPITKEVAEEVPTNSPPMHLKAVVVVIVAANPLQVGPELLLPVVTRGAEGHQVAATTSDLINFFAEY
eukprot:CAMPEP_0117059146 /NCGR_PEP_ID=MMETSP0472-20121206/41072_1 /TAXON_ID=693140 ORGANISM="Tiarina fusus, Strain LIS" /NCGR_SAMPLE_ID=MMETSP0472 /ASSEMBLY_ACC=CAM_ASM_000603 /LENGTH=124 /DNA_ID=CAMNT_0004776715 /DNA_START=648 /DNA_END=1022 /DNA_ORIENTATION=-